MSRLVSVDLPVWAQRAHTVLGDRAGLALLGVLASRGEPVSYRELAVATRLNAQAVSVAMRRLEDAGIVTASVPRGQRPGPGVWWSLEREALSLVLTDVTDVLC